MNNSMGDPENHDNNNNFNFRGGPLWKGLLLGGLAIIHNSPYLQILLTEVHSIHADDHKDDERKDLPKEDKENTEDGNIIQNEWNGYLWNGQNIQSY